MLFCALPKMTTIRSKWSSVPVTGLFSNRTNQPGVCLVCIHYPAHTPRARARTSRTLAKRSLKSNLKINLEESSVCGAKVKLYDLERSMPTYIHHTIHMPAQIHTTTETDFRFVLIYLQQQQLQKSRHKKKMIRKTFQLPIISFITYYFITQCVGDFSAATNSGRFQCEKICTSIFFGTSFHLVRLARIICFCPRSDID